MTQPSPQPGTTPSPTVSLVLGSGGARGLAHIGVIQELEAQGFSIQAISGSSMGALVGGIHAMGELETYSKWVRTLEQKDMLTLLDWSFSGGGMIRGHKIIQKLKDLLGERNIEDLPIRYTAVAVDIERGKEVWISDGCLFDAIRASIAIPAVFTPYRYRGHLLVDGGLLNPVPVEPSLRTLTDLTIVVDVNGPDPIGLEPRAHTDADNGTEGQGLMERMRGYAESLGIKGETRTVEGMALSEVLIRAFETMQSALTRYHLANFRPDLVITIEKSTCMFHEFHHADRLIELGGRKTREGLSRQGLLPARPSMESD